jgi:hypothetical protein
VASISEEDEMTRRLPASLLALALMTSACAPRYRAVALPHDLQPSPGRVERESAAPAPDAWRRLSAQLPPAAVVKVVLADGTRLTGIVLAVDDEGILLKPRTRVPEPPRRIRYTSMESLEVEHDRGIGVGKAVAIGVGTGAATFVSLILLTMAILDD